MFTLTQHHLAYDGQPLWNDLSLHIERGEKVALVGPSGAGKSSLLRLLHAQQPTQVAWCPQELGLVPMLSVYHNIYMAQLERHGRLYNLCNLIRPVERHRLAIADLCETLDLRDKLWTRTERLSGGEQQRVAIARALYRERPVFLGDEPVSALDPQQAERLLALILARHETALVALHDIHLTLSVFDRVIGLKQGIIAFDCPVAQLSAVQLDALYAG